MSLSIVDQLSAIGISGQTVYLTSGFNDVNISGQTVQIAGGINTSISGQPVLISGQTIAIAGGINVSGSPVRISGEVVYLVSGKNAVQTSGQTINAFTYGFDPITGIWRANQITASGDGGRLLVSISGQPVLISGQTVITSVAIAISGISGNVVYFANDGRNNVVKISGESVYLVSGKNDVQISGQTVAIAGGINVSGSPVRVSGEVVYLVSGKNDVQISGQSVKITDGGGFFATILNGANDAVAHSSTIALVVENFNLGYNANADNWSRLRVTASGDGFRLITSVSGQPVQISGQPVLISGQTVAIAGGISSNVSGNVVYLTSGKNDVQISGQTVNIAGGINVSGSPVRVSGEVVYLVSGKNDVQISGQTIYLGTALDGSNDTLVPTFGATMVTDYLRGYDQNANTWPRLRVTASGDGFRLIVSTSGQPVQISGQRVWLADYAGWPLVSILGAGATGVWANGLTVAVISGSVTKISGQSIRINDSNGGSLYNIGVAGSAAGIWDNALMVAVISGSVTKISGQIVRLTDYNGNALLNLFSMGTNAGYWVDSLAVGTTSGSVTQISGQALYLGNYPNAGGYALVHPPDFDSVGVGSYNFLYTNSSLMGLDTTTNTMNRLKTTVSGDGHRLRVSVSGQPIQISGQIIRLTDNNGNPIVAAGTGVAYNFAMTAATVSGSVTQISGQSVRLPNDGLNNVTKVSGQIVRIGSDIVDGVNALVYTSIDALNGANNYYLYTTSAITAVDTSTGLNNRLRTTPAADNYKLLVSVSGQPVRIVPEGQVTIRTASGLVCTSLSGGTQLPSVAADRVTIRMDPDAAGRMFVGSTTSPPFSGMGFKLSPGDGVTLQVAGDCNVFRVFATTSGERTFFIIEDS